MHHEIIHILTKNILLLSSCLGLHQLHLKHSSNAEVNIDNFLQPNWPLRALMGTNVPFLTLLETYEALFDVQQKESTISFKSTKL